MFQFVDHPLGCDGAPHFITNELEQPKKTIPSGYSSYSLSLMVVTESGIYTNANSSQPWKAPYPISVTPAGRITLVISRHPVKASAPIVNVVEHGSNVIDDKPLQLQKAPEAIMVTELGIVIESKPVQSLNAEPSMLVTLLGISIAVRLAQPSNALCPIFVTPLGIIVLLQPFTSVCAGSLFPSVAIVITALQLFGLAYVVFAELTLILFIPCQKAIELNDVTPFGITSVLKSKEHKL